MTIFRQWLKIDFLSDHFRSEIAILVIDSKLIFIEKLSVSTKNHHF